MQRTFATNPTALYATGFWAPMTGLFGTEVRCTYSTPNAITPEMEGRSPPGDRQLRRRPRHWNGICPSRVPVLQSLP